MKKLLKSIVLLSSIAAFLGTLYYYFTKQHLDEANTTEREYDDLDDGNYDDSHTAQSKRSYVSLQTSNSDVTTTSSNITTDELIGEEVMIEDFFCEEEL